MALRTPRNDFVFEVGVTEISKSLYFIANTMANVAKELNPELLIVSTIKSVKMESLSVDCYDSVDALLFSLSFTGINADPPKTMLIPNHTSGEMIEIAIEPVESSMGQL